MKILVLLKLVIDPELPSNKLTIDPITKNQTSEGNPVVISSYDENALEVALKLKDNHGFQVEVLTLTYLEYQQSIKKALAMGADKATILTTNKQFIDTNNTASIIAEFIKKQNYSLILTGYESADWGHRTFAPTIASILNYKLITYAYKVNYQDNNWIIYKILDNGYTVLKTNKNTIVSITTHQENQPRYPKVKDIMLASKKPILVEKIDPSNSNSINVENIEQPQSKIECQIIQGKDSYEKAQKLYEKLKELKIL